MAMADPGLSSEEEFFETYEEIASTSGSDSDGERLAHRFNPRRWSRAPDPGTFPFSDSQLAIWRSDPVSTGERRVQLFQKLGLDELLASARSHPPPVSSCHSFPSSSSSAAVASPRVLRSVSDPGENHRISSPGATPGSILIWWTRSRARAPAAAAAGGISCAGSRIWTAAGSSWSTSSDLTGCGTSSARLAPGYSFVWFLFCEVVTCIRFNPADDSCFLSGSLDGKVRIWSILEHHVIDWTDLREIVTAAAYTPDGTGAMIGSSKGTCRFYNTPGNKLQLDGVLEVVSKKGKSFRGRKISGIQCMPSNPSKILVTSNDSQVRLYDGTDLIAKFKEKAFGT